MGRPEDEEVFVNVTVGELMSAEVMTVTKHVTLGHGRR